MLVSSTFTYFSANQLLTFSSSLSSVVVVCGEVKGAEMKAERSLCLCSPTSAEFLGEDDPAFIDQVRSHVLGINK